jgi:uncharacterized protein (DUF849 family)
VRVGLEDAIYLSQGQLAPSNAELAEKATRIVRDLGGDVTTPEEARQTVALSRSAAEVTGVAPVARELMIKSAG